VNNAATNPAMGPIVETDEKTYDHIMETNLKGYFMMSKFAGAIMVKQKSGNIINISSVGGLCAMPGPVSPIFALSMASSVSRRL
jgi:NAD(P)-dependent dehydrogenase (short-subunit alcohol dehydrogenase family)